MPVRTKPCPNLTSSAWSTEAINDANTMLEKACSSEHKLSEHIIRTSSHFDHKSLAETTISASTNGFVRAALAAYNQHHDLSIRPEDVWFSILTQLSFYVNAHSEELRHVFVSHEGQEQIAIDIAEVLDMGQPVRPLDVDFGTLAIMMAEGINKKLNDKTMLDWIMPNFTTTGHEDKIVAAVLMMGGLKNYFTYYMYLRCGLPSVTLMGERSDWEEIQKRLERLPGLGEEAARWKTLLDPVIAYFIRTFDEPESPEVKTFWNNIAHESAAGSGVPYLSGWLTAFCFWNNDGKPLYSDPKLPVSRGRDGGKAGLDLDGVLYHRVPCDKIPAGYASAAVTINWCGKIFYTRMCAGSVGIQAWNPATPSDGNGSEFRTPPRGQVQTAPAAVPARSGPSFGSLFGRPQRAQNNQRPVHESSLTSIRPVTGWWIYKVPPPEEKKKESEGQGIKAGPGPNEESQSSIASRLGDSVKVLPVQG